MDEKKPLVGPGSYTTGSSINWPLHDGSFPEHTRSFLDLKLGHRSPELLHFCVSAFAQAWMFAEESSSRAALFPESCDAGAFFSVVRSERTRTMRQMVGAFAHGRGKDPSKRPVTTRLLEHMPPKDRRAPVERFRRAASRTMVNMHYA